MGLLLRLLNIRPHLLSLSLSIYIIYNIGDLSHEGHPFHISFSEFAKEIVPNLRACDCVIWIRSCTDYPNKEGDEIRER